MCMLMCCGLNDRTQRLKDFVKRLLMEHNAFAMMRRIDYFRRENRSGREAWAADLDALNDLTSGGLEGELGLKNFYLGNSVVRNKRWIHLSKISSNFAMSNRKGNSGLRAFIIRSWGPLAVIAAHLRRDGVMVLGKVGKSGIIMPVSCGMTSWKTFVVYEGAMYCLVECIVFR